MAPSPFGRVLCELRLELGCDRNALHEEALHGLDVGRGQWVASPPLESVQEGNLRSRQPYARQNLTVFFDW